jgi:signal transduction histidine kinase
LSTELLAWIAAAVALLVSAWQARVRYQLSRRMVRVASACHELRGALAAMRLALSRMEAPVGRGAWLDNVEVLRAQHARALLATEDLESNRGTAPERAIDTSSSVDLESLVRRCVSSWATVHGRGRVVLDWRAGRPRVRGEAGRLAQALDNLVANAVEHGAGRVTVVGRLNPDSVTISVLDLGDGLERSLRDLRPASWRSRRGHGLAIVRRAVEDHGGRMQLVRESSGTGVQIRLPLAPGSPTAGPTGAVLPASGSPGVARSA